jgi:hypothetical protein
VRMWITARRTKYSREMRERAIALVLECQQEYDSQWEVIRPIAAARQKSSFSRASSRNARACAMALVLGTFQSIDQGFRGRTRLGP